MRAADAHLADNVVELARGRDGSSGNASLAEEIRRCTAGPDTDKDDGFAGLEPGGLVLRPGLLLRSRHPMITITEPILSSHERPYEDDAERQRLDAMHYAGTRMQRVVVTCRTPQGTLEIGVRRGDVPLLLHYLAQQGPK